MLMILTLIFLSTRRKNLRKTPMSITSKSRTNVYIKLYAKNLYICRCERPTRAYSIGSKVEHIKMSQILGNLNEVNNSSPRVRAYSVGSKSKIPRCEIQRGVLFTKVKKGYNLKGSNCNVSMDAHTCHDSMGYNNSREVKSTSAPLLNLKHYMNSDRMSDLMEIDFSNGTTNSSSTTSTSQEQKLFNNLEVASRTQNKNISNPNFCSNGNIKQQMLKQDESSPLKQQQQIQPPQSVDNSADSGYLEMKPVGIINLNSKQASLDDQMKTLKLQSTACLQQQQSQIPHDEPINNCKSSLPVTKINPIHAIGLVKPIRNCIADTNADYRSTDNSIESSSKTTNNVTDKLYLNNTDKQKNRLQQLKVDDFTSNLDINNIALDKGNTVGRKLIHSLSNEDYSKYIIKSKTEAAADAVVGGKDVGYQILQIKSDSSLISKKKSIRPLHMPSQHSRKDVNNVDELFASKSANTKINLSLQKSEALANNNKDAKTTDTVVKDEAATSASAATSSGAPCDHHELHYASLDLPQCSEQITSKCLKKVSCESPPVESFESKNSYAKIDFDQSDSSSASSKVCNV